MRTISITFLIVLFSSCNQKEKVIHTPESSEIKGPSDFFSKDRAKVLVVGTFHFNYPGKDDHKTAESNKVDVLTEPKKSEVTELVNYIKKFRPTKIAIEAFPSWQAMTKYREYLAGKHLDKRDERYQLGMRIAKEYHLDTLYSVDARSLQRELAKKDSLLFDSLFEKVDWDIEDPYWDMAKKWLDYNDVLTKEMTLLDYFAYMNSKESHQYGYGMYLTGAFATGQGQGADNLAVWWYNRNLRIFANIINITESNEDRILVVMGNGHAAILRQLFEASPQFEFIEFDSL